MKEHAAIHTAGTQHPSSGPVRLEFPGFFDLQVNGYHGLEFNAPDLRSNSTSVLNSMAAPAAPAPCASTDLLTGKCK